MEFLGTFILIDIGFHTVGEERVNLNKELGSEGHCKKTGLRHIILIENIVDSTDGHIMTVISRITYQIGVML